MRLHWRTELVQWLVLAGMLVVAAASWRGAPDRIPVHWNVRGQVDDYAGKFEGLFGIPLLALGVYLLFLVVPRIDPGRANYQRFTTAYHTLRVAMVMFFAAIYGVIVLWSRGIEVSVSTLVPLLVGALFVVFGNLLGKVRPNWFFGIRTPWTLSSKLAWTRTHRAGGWFFVILGFAFMLAGLLRVPWFSIAAMVALFAGTVGLAIYSYCVWRTDPDKIPPSGTLPGP